MKRILFCIPDFRQGGIPRCLQSLLMNIDTESYSVDVFCLNHAGPYRGCMPHCHVWKEDFVIKSLTLFTRSITWKNAVWSIPALLMKFVRWAMQKTLKRDWLLERLSAIAKKVSGQGHYDVAIAYAEGLAAKVVENVDCKRKLVWLHNDYAHAGAREGAALTDFCVFDLVCCVSKATQDSFDRAFPQFASNSVTIYNLINVEMILSQASEACVDSRFMPQKGTTIVSIGRICAQKNFTCIPKIASSMREKMEFVWYIIGDGSEYEEGLLKEEIRNFGVQDCVVLLGGKDNPYCYLAKADLFVLTSIYESYPTVINEAKVLHVPIVANDIPPVYEMLPPEEAVIVNVERMAEAIIALMCDNVRLERLKAVPLRNHNAEVLNAFYRLLDWR